MVRFAEFLGELRKAKELSQQEVAVALGISQATISRIENGESFPSDVRQLAKLAKLLDVPMSELLAALPDDFSAATAGETPFYAFCSNPFCESNRLLRTDGKDFVKWASGEQQAGMFFDEVNFCDSCGGELTKDCKNCRRPLTKLSKYCIKCGEQIYIRPTPDEWKRIKTILDRQEPKAPPSEDIPF